MTARGRAAELTGGEAGRAHAALLGRNPIMSGFLARGAYVCTYTVAVVVGYGSPERLSPGEDSASL